jgi:hypothetical protein
VIVLAFFLFVVLANFGLIIFLKLKSKRKITENKLRGELNEILVEAGIDPIPMVGEEPRTLDEIRAERERAESERAIAAGEKMEFEGEVVDLKYRNCRLCQFYMVSASAPFGAICGKEHTKLIERDGERYECREGSYVISRAPYREYVQRLRRPTLNYLPY